MRRISRIALLATTVGVLSVGGSALAVAKNGARGHAHAKLADVIKDVKDAHTDSADHAKDIALAQNDLTTPDLPGVAQQEQADAQNEQVDNQSENQDGKVEGDSAAQAIACQGLLTDNVQYDDQTGTCTAETGQDNSSTTGSQDSGTTAGVQDSGTSADGQSGSQNG